MARSLRTSLDGVKKAESTLKRKGWTHEYLAGGVRCSRQIVGNFFARRTVEKRLFQAICSELGLEWGEIAEPEAGGEQARQISSVDELVQTVRSIIRENAQKRYGTMRVLDMEQPIGLDDIYTNVNILKKVAGRKRVDINELLKNAAHEDFYRFGLSNIQEARVPGIDAVEAHQKLMLLGKPGAGKSTFLKHLMLQCIGETFQAERIPAFVTLKDFAEAANQPSLLDYLRQVFSSYGVAPDVKVKTGMLESLLSWNETSVEQLLRQGRLLILLDGLDEVREADNKRVLRQIQSFADQFDKNQFVITCRIAAKEYTFDQFREVEIADFTDEQITSFANKWFLVKNDLVKGERFIEKLKDNHRIRELATNPLLLTLLCLVFEELGSFPPNRAELYKEGLDVLLKRWDNSRNIERDEIYKGLPPQRKEDLLSKIAWDRFEQGDYFFKQSAVEEQISQYIRNLPNATIDSNTLQINSQAVLKSIEAQHGLLVERARGIYSFSHLTFQEYFTARRIKERRSEEILQTLASHLTEKRWQEVFLLTTGMLEDADRLLILMKQQCAALLAEDEQLQHFLHWVSQKSKAVEVTYKPAAVRAFYFALALDHDLVLGHARARDLGHARDRALARALDLDLALALDFALALALAQDLTLDLALDLTLDLARDLARALDRSRARTLALARTRNRDLTHALALAHTLARDLALARTRARTLDPVLQHSLEQLRQELLNSSLNNRRAFEQWWAANGSAWTEQLRAVIFEHRNIGHDWQFSDAQKKKFQQYYDANKLLVNCLNSDCYVSREVREEIEEGLLLPLHSQE